MIGVSKHLALYLLGVCMVCGCAQTPCLVVRPAPDAKTKIGLLEQVAEQQERIDVLERELAELWNTVDDLWWRSEQVKIETLEWELEQLWRIRQEERVEALEYRLAELGTR